MAARKKPQQPVGGPYPLPGQVPQKPKQRAKPQKIGEALSNAGWSFPIPALKNLNVPAGYEVEAGQSVSDEDLMNIASQAEAWADQQRTMMGTPFSGAGGVGGGLTAAEKAQQQALNRYTRQLQGLLRSGSYRAPQDQLMQQLQTQYQAATPQINTAYENLISQLQSQTNPYANMQAVTTQATPELQQLLQSQGVSTDPLQQFATALNTQNQGQATAFQNLINTMSGIQSAGQTGMIDAARAQQANALAALEGQRAGYATQLESQAAGQQQNFMEMLLNAIAKGGAPRKGRLF